MLRSTAVWGSPQFSQDRHVSIHRSLLICYTGTGELACVQLAGVAWGGIYLEVIEFGILESVFL